jgi:ComF family protein
MIEKLINATLALVYPMGCVVCAQSVESRKDGIICDECWRKTRIFKGREVACHKCGALAQNDIAREIATKIFCRRCDEDAFDNARAVGVYEGALRASILSLKIKPYISPRLAELLFDAQRREPLNKATQIVPVPLHEERLKERSFNQAAILANTLSKKTKLPVNEHCVARVIHTEKHRSGMDAKARRESVEGAFKVLSSRLVKGEKILLVDDVFTTGATVSSCAKALKEAGVGEVFVLTVARPMF